MASWLLLASRGEESEMTLTQANRRKPGKLSAADPGPVDTIEKLPAQLQE